MIGGGAAGLTAAYFAAENCRQVSQRLHLADHAPLLEHQEPHIFEFCMCAGLGPGKDASGWKEDFDIRRKTMVDL